MYQNSQIFAFRKKVLARKSWKSQKRFSTGPKSFLIKKHVDAYQIDAAKNFGCNAKSKG